MTDEYKFNPEPYKDLINDSFYKESLFHLIKASYCLSHVNDDKSEVIRKSLKRIISRITEIRKENRK